MKVSHVVLTRQGIFKLITFSGQEFKIENKFLLIDRCRQLFDLTHQLSLLIQTKGNHIGFTVSLPQAGQDPGPANFLDLVLSKNRRSHHIMLVPAVDLDDLVATVTKPDL